MFLPLLYPSAVRSFTRTNVQKLHLNMKRAFFVPIFFISAQIRL